MRQRENHWRGASAPGPPVARRAGDLPQRTVEAARRDRVIQCMHCPTGSMRHEARWSPGRLGPRLYRLVVSAPGPLGPGPSLYRRAGDATRTVKSPPPGSAADECPLSGRKLDIPRRPSSRIPLGTSAFGVLLPRLIEDQSVAHAPMMLCVAVLGFHIGLEPSLELAHQRQ
jgi:hypothetical protein